MIDIIDAELQADCGLSLRWYDVLVHLEDAPEGLRMNELAGRILASKSGLTRVVDNMDKAGLVRRERPEDDRRTVLVFITPRGGCRRSVPVSRDLSRVIGSLVSPRSFSS
jgi:DNA-binding MarR family transcriptional regulator